MKRSPKPKTTTLPKEQYWQLRALLRDVTLAQREAEAHVNMVGTKAQQYMTTVGLRNDINYTFDDKTFTMTEVPGPAPQTAKT